MADVGRETDPVGARLSTPKDTPPKLRCAGCDKLAQDAWTLPCCAQNICGLCQSSLRNCCPVCMHSPLGPDGCIPNKNLRMTVKAFLKSQEKKQERRREEEKLTAQKNEHMVVEARDVPNESATSVSSSSLALAGRATLLTMPDADRDTLPRDSSKNMSALEQDPLHDEENETAVDHERSAPSSPSSSIEITLDLPQGRTETVTAFGKEAVPNNETFPDRVSLSDESHGSIPSFQTTGRSGDRNANDLSVLDIELERNNTGAAFGTVDQGQWFDNGFNAMMAMQSSMNPAMWASYQGMLGMGNMMPAASMNPMMIPGMFGGYDGMTAQAYVGAGGYGIGSNGWSMGMDLGTSSGFFTPAGHSPNQVYNGHLTNNNIYPHRVRGQSYQRGQRGSRPHNQHPMKQAHHGNHGFQNGYQNARTVQPEDSVRHNEDHEMVVSPNTLSADVGAEMGKPERIEQSPDSKLNLKNAFDVQAEHASGAAPSIPSFDIELGKGPKNAKGEKHASHVIVKESSAPRSIDPPGTTAKMSRPELGSHVSGLGGAMGGRGSGHFTDSARIMGVASDSTAPGVLGAPTGPKAMREGRPNVGFRGRGGPQTQSIALTHGPPASMFNAGEAHTSADCSNDHKKDLSDRRVPSKSPSRLSGHRHKRPRSRSVDAGEDLANSQRTERKHRSPHHTRHSSHEKSLEHHNNRNRSPHRPSRRKRDMSRDHSRGRTGERRQHRHRSRTPEEAKAKSIRDKSMRDSYYDSERNKQDEKRNSFRERQTRSGNDPDDDRSQWRKIHASGSVENEKRTVHETKFQDRNVRTELDIQKDLVKEEHPRMDPHALEREARNRERLLKEQQRRESLTLGPMSSAGRKRGRNVDNDGQSEGYVNGDEPHGSRKKARNRESGLDSRSRKLNHLYVNEETEEARALRVEIEREAERWG